MTVSQEKYLTKQNSAYEIVRQVSPEPTPLTEVKKDNSGNVYYQKNETNNPTGAYKWRGAAVKLSKLFENGAHSVVTASAGNHGQGVAWVSGFLGAKASPFTSLYSEGGVPFIENNSDPFSESCGNEDRRAQVYGCLGS